MIAAVLLAAALSLGYAAAELWLHLLRVEAMARLSRQARITIETGAYSRYALGTPARAMARDAVALAQLLRLEPSRTLRGVWRVLAVALAVRVQLSTPEVTPAQWAELFAQHFKAHAAEFTPRMTNLFVVLDTALRGRTMTQEELAS